METKDVVMLGVVALAAWLLLRDKGEPVNKGVPESYMPVEAEGPVVQFQPYRIGGV
jgi:hypothetical protein